MAASAPADPAGGPPPPTDRARAHRTLVCVAGIGVTQIVGWGSTFFVPAVLGRHIQEELGLPSEVVFAGVTIMFAISGVAAPRVGRHVDRHGGRRVMAAGSVLAALALVGLSMSQGLVGYIAAWIAIGMATAMMLSTPAFTTLAQVAGPGARRALAMLTTVAGMSSTVFWPLTGALDAALGWRSTVLVFAATHILLCLPIHLFIVPAGAAGRAPEPAGGAKPAPEPPPAANHRLTFPLLAIALSLGTLVYNGLSLHMIEVFRQLGHGPAVAVAIASMIGPAQVGIRIVEIALGNRYAAMSSGLVAAATLPLALA
ncbi:MAG: MFS transporter, partial [Rhodospirillales bacterium]|nr:MFS transporter [Rhodospirillales bacterium]